MTPRRKLTLIVAGFIGLSLLLIAYATYRTLVYSATIDITFAPRSAAVTIDGKGAAAGKNAVIPGKHQIVITREGFAEYKTEVEAIKGETVLVEAILESNDLSTANWYSKNLDDYELAQGIGDGAADRYYDEQLKKMPILKDLPINGLYGSYQVSAQTTDSDSDYTLLIRYTSETAKEEAIKAIEEKGYNLKDYKVTYTQITTTVNNIALPGIVILSERGLDKTIVDTVAYRLTRTYTKYNGETVVSIEFADDLRHVISNDTNTDTYTIVLTINDEYKRRLKITRGPSGPPAITVSAPDGSGERSI